MWKRQFILGQWCLLCNQTTIIRTKALGSQLLNWTIRYLWQCVELNTIVPLGLVKAGTVAYSLRCEYDQAVQSLRLSIQTNAAFEQTRWKRILRFWLRISWEASSALPHDKLEAADTCHMERSFNVSTVSHLNPSIFNLAQSLTFCPYICEDVLNPYNLFLHPGQSGLIRPKHLCKLIPVFALCVLWKLVPEKIRPHCTTHVENSPNCKTWIGNSSQALLL